MAAADRACPSLNPEDAAARLRDGGVLVLPTDTLPGLHARADRPASLARIRAMKGRDDGKPFLLLAASLEQALELCAELDAGRIAALEACWPGPFSVVLPVRPEGLPGVTDGDTVAVRVPDRADLRSLVAAAGFPLASTSANREGRAPALSVDEAAGVFAGEVDGRWDPAWSREEAADPRPSTLVDLTGAEARILRQGGRPWPGGASS